MPPTDSHALQRLTRRETVQLLDLLRSCARCSSREEFDVIVEGLKGLFPFEFFACLSAPIEGRAASGPLHVINVDYPSEWMGLYMERGYQAVDPVLKENFRSFRVQYWADTYKAGPTDREFVGEAEGFGLRSGYTSGIRDLAGSRGGLFSFAGRAVGRSARTEAVIEAVTPHLYVAVARMTEADRLKSAPALTDREREALRWTAQGKTTWETAAILNISERTVKFHMKNVMKKLNAVSRTHAAAVAAELGLIDLD